MPSAEQVGAISIPNGALLLTLRVYQIRSRGEKKCGWSRDSLGFSPKHIGLGVVCREGGPPGRERLLSAFW